MVNGIDPLAVEGVSTMSYAIPSVRVTHVLTGSPVRIGYWRSIGHTHNIFFLESFINEMAEHAQFDPYQYRRMLLKDDARSLAVLDLAAQMSGWGKTLSGRHQGIAFYRDDIWKTRVAQVVEVEKVDGPRGFRIRRIVCVADSGRLVNPDAAASQLQGGSLFGLSAALTGAITLKQGAAKQSNFHDYPVLTLADAPPVDVAFIQGSEELGGVGEIAVPAIAPALAGAVFSATSRRVRELPFFRDRVLGTPA